MSIAIRIRWIYCSARRRSRPANRRRGMANNESLTTAKSDRNLVPKLLFGNPRRETPFRGSSCRGMRESPGTRNGVSRKCVPKQEFGNEERGYMELPKPEVLRCFFEKSFEPCLPAMELRWDPDA